MMGCKYIPIPKEDTYALIERAQKGDEEAMHRLVEQNTGLVKSIALKFSSSEYETEDLVQIGFMGLLKAINKFDVSYDVMFSTYAVPMIMGEIKRHFRDHGKIKISRTLKSEIQVLRQMQSDLSVRFGTAPRLSQLAEAMGTTTDHILEIMEASEQVSHIVSLDDQLTEKEYESARMAESPEKRLDWIMMKSEIENLEKKEKQVILLRYFRDMTQSEIAELMHVSQVQVSRIEKKALMKIRKKLVNCIE